MHITLLRLPLHHYLFQGLGMYAHHRCSSKQLHVSSAPQGGLPTHAAREVRQQLYLGYCSGGQTSVLEPPYTYPVERTELDGVAAAQEEVEAAD